MSTQIGAGFFFHSTYSNRIAQWRKIRDCVAGNEKIKEAAKTYLPQPTGLNDQEYANYKTRAVFYPVADRTVRGLVGAIFRVDPITQMPSNLEQRKMNMTPDSLSINVAIKKFVTEMLSIGRAGLFIDLPAEATNEPPYSVVYRAEDITHWKREYVNGKQIYTRVMIREHTDTNSGGTDEVRFLELLLVDGVYTVQEWFAKFKGGIVGDNTFHDAKPGEIFTPNVSGRTLDEIPFIIGNTYNNGAEVEKSPVLDLCDINLAHYHNSADYEHCLFMLASPTPYIIGKLQKNELPTDIGANAFWHINADPNEVMIGMLEYSGTGSEDLRQAMEDKEGQMEALGAMLVRKDGGPETAEAVRIKAGQSVSILDSVVINSEDAWNDGLAIMDKWTNQREPEDSQAKTKLNRNFIQEELDVALFNAIRDAKDKNQVSSEVVHGNYQRMGIMPEERTLEDEQDAIEEDKEKNAEENGEPVNGENNGEENNKEKGDEETEKETVSRQLEQGSTDHTHTATLDENGNGTSSANDSEAAGNHSHKVVNGTVQTGGSNNHSHPLSD